MSATRVRKTADEAPAPLSDNDIYERMVSAILDHQLPPGTKLVEDRLAAAFGVSRTRIRPVLVRLANEKVVTLTPNRGAAIAEPSEQEAREVFEVRRMIEPLLVERFIGQGPHIEAGSPARHAGVFKAPVLLLIVNLAASAPPTIE